MWGARARWWAIAIFQLTELDIKANLSCLDVFVEDMFMSLRFKAKENLQRCGDVFFDIVITRKQGSFGSRYDLIHFETI